MIETIVLVAYSMLALGVARVCARAVYYDSSYRNWEMVCYALLMGIGAGALCAIWLPFYGLKRAAHDSPEYFARLVFGEPEDEKSLRVLEQKVGVKRHTKALEQELLEQ